ncbi:hypothetical protein BGX27_006205 [Mortierella sp. AM989]|nr:hypothetical protein BGX27_006205 [Mortierella sp. AM989]
MDEHAPIVYDLAQYKEETKDWNSDPSAYLLRYYTKYYFLATGGKDLKSSNDQKIIDQQTSLEILRGDQFIYQSPNKLCITGLAPTHPLLAQRDRYKVLSLRFDPKILSSLPQPTAIPANSKKQPPPSCHCDTVICKIEALDLWAKKDLEGNEEEKAVNAETGSTTTTTDETSETEAANTVTETDPKAPASTIKSNEQTEGKPKESIDPSRVIFVVRSAISGHVIELNERLLRRDTPEIIDPTVIETMLEKASTHGFIAVIRPKIDKTEIALKDLCTMDDYERMRYRHAVAMEQ